MHAVIGTATRTLTVPSTATAKIRTARSDGVHMPSTLSDPRRPDQDVRIQYRPE
jgi:hypothetical protein